MADKRIQLGKDLFKEGTAPSVRIVDSDEGTKLVIECIINTSEAVDVSNLSKLEKEVIRNNFRDIGEKTELYDNSMVFKIDSNGTNPSKITLTGEITWKPPHGSGN